MTILGLETSCDETAAAVARGTGGKITILSNVVSSQIEIHKKYNGVVPEIAAREHVINILPVIEEALKKAGINRQNASQKIDRIAVATEPGLITSLLVGTETAKSIGYAWNLPIININHIEGHIYANFIGQSSSPNPRFPILALTVSGGHTMLILMAEHGKFKVIGETRDDAAGEAFDKAAKMMGLGYPGGPIISKQAEKIRDTQKSKICLPRPMINNPNFDFSFSGLKTALRYALEEDKKWPQKIPEYCAEFQQAVVDVLIFKTIKAAQKFKVKTVMLAGGVAANRDLRAQLKKSIANLKAMDFRMPALPYTTDNAAMVAAAGYFISASAPRKQSAQFSLNCFAPGRT